MRSACGTFCSSSYSCSERFHSLRHALMMIFCTWTVRGRVRVRVRARVRVRLGFGLGLGLGLG